METQHESCNRRRSKDTGSLWWHVTKMPIVKEAKTGNFSYGCYWLGSCNISLNTRINYEFQWVFFDRSNSKYSEGCLALSRVKLTDRVRNCFCMRVDFILRRLMSNTPTLYKQVSLSVSNNLPVPSTAAAFVFMIIQTAVFTVLLYLKPDCWPT